MEQFSIPVILGVITIVEAITGRGEIGGSVRLWILYGLYKLATH